MSNVKTGKRGSQRDRRAASSLDVCIAPTGTGKIQLKSKANIYMKAII